LKIKINVKKAEKAYNSGDYEKASKHAGVNYWEK